MTASIKAVNSVHESKSIGGYYFPFHNVLFFGREDHAQCGKVYGCRRRMARRSRCIRSVIPKISSILSGMFPIAVPFPVSPTLGDGLEHDVRSIRHRQQELPVSHALPKRGWNSELHRRHDAHRGLQAHTLRTLHNEPQHYRQQGLRQRRGAA